MYQYNEAGKLTKIKFSDADGEVTATQVFEYDGAGRLASRLLYGRDGSFEGKTLMRTYDDKGRIASEAYGDDENATYYRKTVFRYDDHDNVVLEEDFEANNVVTDRTSYTYRFDSVGNWTMSRAVHWNNRDGGWTYDTHRLIKYY